MVAVRFDGAAGRGVMTGTQGEGKTVSMALEEIRNPLQGSCTITLYVPLSVGAQDEMI
jgi:hypothetical protein